MKKVLETGEDFLSKEKTRLKGLMDNKSTGEKKRAEFSRRLNVLNTFGSVDVQN
jgi:hypothetical protein